MAVWYSLWSFGIFFPIWYVWTKKNLATLTSTENRVFPLIEFPAKIESKLMARKTNQQSCKELGAACGSAGE
jgi:hypothetical protein